jgi:uncharacterized protein involved in outer membrane biogenesis
MNVPKLSRRALVVSGFVLLLPVVLLALVIIVLESEWAERRIEQFATERLNRTVQLDEIDLRLAWPPRIHLQLLRIANPDWAKTQDLVDAQDIAATIEFLPLFSGRVVIDLLTIGSGRAGLEQEGERATWRFGPADDQPSPFQLQEAHVDDAWIYYRNPALNTALHIQATGELGPQGGSIALTAKGTFRGDPAHARAKASSLLLARDEPMTLRLEAAVGPTSGTFDGTIQASRHGLRSIDAQVDVRGQTIEHLFDLFGINAPATPPYELHGQLRHSGMRWALDSFSGKVGDSDLRGSLSYDRSGKKPMLTADLQSKLLDFDDLGPLVGAPPGTGSGETASPSQKRQAQARKRDSDLLPDAQFETTRWSEMNADVRLEAAKVRGVPALPVNHLTAHVALQDAVLRVRPLVLGTAGGRVESKITVDANQSPAKAELDLTARNVELTGFFAGGSKVAGGLGKLYGNAHLTGRGHSVEALFATATGELTAAISGGRISALLVEAAGLDLAEALAVIASKDVQTPLRCAVADFNVNDGIARAQAFVIDTRDTVVRVEGTINLERERYDLVVHPHPKDPSVFSLRSPLLVTGPLGDPNVRPQAAPIAARIGGAALLALVNPLLAVAPFIEPGTADDANCNALLERAKSGDEKS